MALLVQWRRIFFMDWSGMITEVHYFEEEEGRKEIVSEY